MRPRRVSLAVSTICGSPIAASSRSVALAYRIGSVLQASRYSESDISLSRRDSNERMKALKMWSLNIVPSRIRSDQGLLLMKGAGRWVTKTYWEEHSFPANSEFSPSALCERGEDQSCRHGTSDNACH